MYQIRTKAELFGSYQPERIGLAAKSEVEKPRLAENPAEAKSDFDL
jgi:hypothetical protein